MSSSQNKDQVRKFNAERDRKNSSLNAAANILNSNGSRKPGAKGHHRNNTIAGTSASVFPTDAAIDAFQS